MIDRLRALAAPIARLMFARYLLASIIALSGDVALFLALSGAGAPSALSACSSYLTGMLIHWGLSIRFVFTCDRPSHGQRIAFVASALAGLLVTVAVVEAVIFLGFSHAAAKLVAIPISFGTVYAIRKYGVFSPA